MNFFFDERQRAHDPQFRLENGRIVQNPDRPDRVRMLLAGAIQAGLSQQASTDHGLAPIAAVHTPRYIEFLRTVYARRAVLVPNLTEVVPGRICVDPIAHYSDDSEAQIGFHNSDTSCPISAQTWDAVYWSAQTALSGAGAIMAGARAAYALSRPSGHHAFRERAGGFCFLNNSSIAAEHLRTHGHRPAVLDIDVHHGNGTQGIFYARDDVLTLSLHVDPARFYPFYSGATAETGFGRGEGYNLNLLLPQGAGMDAYAPALARALDRIADFGATVIVVALGLDTHENDPFKGLTITRDDLSSIGDAICNTGLPVLNVQEGGYMQPGLGDNLAAYLGSFRRQPAQPDAGPR